VPLNECRMVLGVLGFFSSRDLAIRKGERKKSFTASGKVRTSEIVRVGPDNYQRYLQILTPPTPITLRSRNVTPTCL
jgi:hypothetical protein